MMTIIAFAKQVAPGSLNRRRALSSVGWPHLSQRSLEPGSALRRGARGRRWAGVGSAGPGAVAAGRWRGGSGGCRRRRAAAAEAVADLAEGGAFLLHRAVAAVGDPGGGDQAEEDAERGLMSTETPPKLPSRAGRRSGRGSAGRRAPPSTATTALSGNGGSQSESVRRSRRPRARRRSPPRGRSGCSRARPRRCRRRRRRPEMPLPPETSTPNQSKNMKMKSTIAETAGDLLPRAQLV